MKGRKWTYSGVLQVLIVVAAYGYLGYRLITFEGYEAFVAYFSQVRGIQALCLLGAFLLFPLNILLESLRWRDLLRGIVPDLSLREAQRQTYYGFVGAFFTPSRLGEYPSRALLLRDRKDWLSAVALGFVGSLLLVLVISLFGLPAMIELFVGQKVLVASDTVGDWHYWWAIAAFLFLLVLAGCLPQMARWIERRFRFRKEQTKQMLEALGKLNKKQLWGAWGWSVLRYLTFCLQLFFVLIACGVNYPLFLAIPTYYLLVTLTPTVPAADVAIKGSWAIVVFSAVGGNVASITMATVLMWIINTICPMIVGTFVNRVYYSTGK